MKKSNNDDLRNYLLNNVASEEERERIEEKLMLDDDYFAELELIEEELIQEYSDNELSGAERAAFEKYLSSSPQNFQRVKFARAFSNHLQKQKNAPGKKIGEPRTPWKFSVRSFGWLPLAATVAGFLIVCGFAWHFYFRVSEVGEAMLSLNRAYQSARPFESRVTGFEYAPFGNVRGDRTKEINFIERDRAEIVLLNEVSRHPNAENLHALGRLYLAKGMFDGAVEQFLKAQPLDAANAKIYNDLGAARLEKFKTLDESEKSNNPQLSPAALENFEKALELDPNLPEARFNRAVCLEILNLPNQAKKAWLDYLNLDSNSEWSQEARRHLKTLDAQSLSEKSADEMEAAFLAAFLDKRDDDALRIAALNRELITEKYLPQKLAFSIVESAPVERIQKIEALRYLGELEKKSIGDFFSADLAAFYAALPEAEYEKLKKAHVAVRRGYKLCLEEDDFKEAIKEFTLAENLFEQAGNRIEAATISRYFVAYCLYTLDDRRAATRILNEINDYTEAKNYKWFALMNYYWLLGGQESLGLKTISEIRGDYEMALKQSEKMRDNYMTQKFLLSLVLKSFFVKQEKKTFFYLQKILAFSNQPNLSVRQKFRNLDKIVEITAAGDYAGLSKAVVLESVALAEALVDPAFVIESEINAGIVHTRTENYDEAERWLRQAEQKSAELPNEEQRRLILAPLFLQSGNLEKKRGNSQKAVGYYDAALAVSDQTETPLQIYEIKKSRLLAYQALGDTQAVENDLAPTLRLAEEYRKKITDEQERHSFFDNQQTVFDIATEHGIEKNQYEQAFDYAETANSRSLLDWLRRGAAVKTSEQRAEILFEDSSTPLKISEIRERMPPEVEMLQYSVLENRVLIWLVSKDKFALASADVNSKQLKTAVDKYVNFIKSNDPATKDEARAAARELYKWLIDPILPQLSENKEIAIVPNKFLFYLPFSALVSADGKFLLEQRVLTYAPSANVFISCVENAKGKQSLKEEKLLSVGNPTFDRRKLPDLADLPESKTEADEITRNYSESKPLLGTEASKKAFLDFYQNYEVIHFAGHYIAQPDAPLSSKMVMANRSEIESENFISNAELLDRKLPRAKLVVLSACQTGVEGYYNGEGLIGLSRTFLAAGVPLVVASQWSVESAATSELMKKFHRYRRAGNLSTSRALRQSQLDLLNDSDLGFKEPFFWAGFAVFGGHASF